jgi:hypothetical protein
MPPGIRPVASGSGIMVSGEICAPALNDQNAGVTIW